MGINFFWKFISTMDGSSSTISVNDCLVSRVSGCRLSARAIVTVKCTQNTAWTVYHPLLKILIFLRRNTDDALSFPFQNLKIEFIKLYTFRIVLGAVTGMLVHRNAFNSTVIAAQSSSFIRHCDPL